MSTPKCKQCGFSINHQEENILIKCNGRILFNSDSLTECKRQAFARGLEIFETEKAIDEMYNGVVYHTDRNSIYWLKDHNGNRAGMIITGKLSNTMMVYGQ